jgi:hypothetical protein
MTDDEAAAMFRAALNLFRLWGITDEEAATLLDLPVRTYRRWKAGDIGRIDRDGKAGCQTSWGSIRLCASSFVSRNVVTLGSRRLTPLSPTGRP